MLTTSRIRLLRKDVTTEDGPDSGGADKACKAKEEVLMGYSSGHVTTND